MTELNLTHEQIIQIQTGGIDWNGAPLDQPQPDGIWGPKTAWWAGILTLPFQREKIIRTCLKYYHDDTREDAGRPNRGTVIDSFEKPAGLLGEPWCIMFTSKVLRECYFDPDVWPYHTSAYGLIEWAKKTHRVVKDPLPGDLFAFLHLDDPKHSGHGGIVLAADALWIADCDGNVGDRVRVGRRARDGLTFIRTVDDVGPQLVMPPRDKLDNLDGTRTR